MAASNSAEPASGAAGTAAGAGPARKRFRRWRRSRPFWGGLLLLAAGAELLFIPLENVFMRAAVGVMMQMGIGGVSGVLLGIVLSACGLLLWYDPGHRLFYGVVGVAGGVISFPASNFGGFFLGLLLAVTGGALALGWAPLSPRDASGRGGPSRPSEPDQGLGLVLGAPPAAGGTVPADGPQHQHPEGPGAAPAAGPAPGARVSPPASRAHRRVPWRERLLPGPGRGATMLVLVLAGAAAAGPLLTAGRAEASATPSPSPSPGQQCVLVIICPGPAPSPAPSPSPGLLPLPVPLPSVPGGLLPGPSPGATGKPRKPPAAAGTPGLEAYTAPVVLTAGAAHVTHFAYQGDADVPAAGGGTLRMMKFTATSFTAANGIRGEISQGGHATALTASSLAFTGGITLYAAKFSGRLAGVPVTLTPGNAETVLLRLLRSVTPAMPLTMTNVSASQPIIVAGSFQGQFTLSAG